MPEVRKASRLRDHADKGFYITATTSSKREAGSHLHGVFFEEKLEKKE
jgi:hypothetical protein